ncbi:hypothetical protein DFQ04_0649 [Algoriphagus boseongensis]|uniref:Uncharacterized protein n=1 Tax=Algoriphagus boseongensis TaxID=1442587 RepID=A0A4R6T819_9BACT|nr:hypothetical protein DFQ04_0649 [Algoriphagus boseongensis]
MICSILVLALASKGMSQSIELETDLNQYFLATQAKDWNKVLDMVNPRIFSIAPKDMMQQMYSQMESDSGMKFHFSEIKILGYKTELILQDTSYVPVDYSMILNIKLNPEIFKTPEHINMLHQGFEKTYAGQEVQFDQENAQFFIGVKNTLVASSAKNSNQWFFSEYKANDPLLSKILPAEVIDRLQKGWSQ